MEAELIAKALPGTPSRRTVVTPSALRCGLMILATKTALQLWGFGRTLRFVRRRVERVDANETCCMEVVRAVERAVAMAGALYPGRALCLEQSLVLYYLLRRQGVAVRYCHGVQPYPFEAHAWIEYRGEPINDVPEHVRGFARLQGELP
jgi:hypothetical protein